MPMTTHATDRAKPCGLPQISKIFARGSLHSPPMRLEKMLVVAVREWRANELVTYGVSVQKIEDWRALTK
jgi:hypothetical protein